MSVNKHSKWWFVPVLATVVFFLGSVGSSWAQQPVQPNEHLLGAGDLIRITVFQNPELSTETRVSERGQITFPLVGTLTLQGLSIAAAQDHIARQLRDGGFVLKPEVSLLLVEVRSAQVSVLGQVGAPGRYPLGTSVSKVSEVLAAAGGVLPDGADIVTLVGTRNGQPYKAEIDLPAVLQTGRVDQDVVLSNGDTIYVARAPEFYIYGEVQNPGAFRLQRGMTLMQALAMGGGLTQRGTERGIRLHRRDASGAVQVLQVGMEEAVLQGDVIYVRQSLF